MIIVGPWHDLLLLLTLWSISTMPVSDLATGAIDLDGSKFSASGRTIALTHGSKSAVSVHGIIKGDLLAPSQHTRVRTSPRVWLVEIRWHADIVNNRCRN